MDKVLFLPFEASRFFTYKYEKKLVLEYPYGTFGESHLTNFLASNPTPTLGFTFLRQNKSHIKVPFGEVVIESVIRPNDIQPIWELIYRHSTMTGKSLTESFLDIRSIHSIPPVLDEAISLYLSQKNHNDSEIGQFIKFVGGKVSGNSSLLWFVCSVLENFTSGLQTIKFHDFLLGNNRKPHFRSLFSLVSINDYLFFRNELKNKSDYSVGEDARDLAFGYLKANFISTNHHSLFKKLSEKTWRDLITTPQYNYQHNNKTYKILFHNIWELYKNEDFTFVDFDTEVKWQTTPPSLGGVKRGSLDAFIHLTDSVGTHWKLYIEFKNFNETLTDIKDVEYQPYAIFNNDFSYSRYKHNSGDQWLYIAITRGTPHYKINATLPKHHYMDFTWSHFFDQVMTKVYPLAISSSDKNLLNFINFLFNK
ncbi:hypothetical protein WQ57_02055 [Mesobacillus campisalis]|uniref:Uncharacterized protein n=1 Tax=Mesobacillus campisalis TaxID=1408103 RepID=A0A0M2T0I6_9BACI|nr:hypothetical protein [Mesobacillus campisalis]KKK39496.1 hypothetical protein WQ57_02055 [Mesobacillus campisalis]